MVYRIYVEKKPGFALEADALCEDIRSFLGIGQIARLRILNRYDVEGISQELMAACRDTVFCEPPVDMIHASLPGDAAHVFAVEYLPGQFDQRADSAAQCIQLLAQGERPTVRTAKVYLLYGEPDAAQLAAIKRHVINPVESREAVLDEVETLALPTESPAPVPVLDGFIGWSEAQLADAVLDYALAMDAADIACCQAYFRQEQRDPTLTELRVLDTYWSDHCRHTTFLTSIEGVQAEDPALQAAFERYLALREALGRSDRPITLMDIATIGARYLKHTGVLTDEDESPEINACTIRITAKVDGHEEPWLLLFKNETHNHPTEIEPFGGAATCIGGAIRDPLSGRAYVYQAMRVTGAADPLAPLSATLPGKLPQRKLTTTAAAGYSSYGNQIGLATGRVDEIYHPGYAAKRMEIGAVLGAAPAANVRREAPAPGDVVVLLGGKTGRDGCGGATGSSKSHNASSLTACGAEVQKGNAPEERKLQRLMRNPAATRLIKRCNDFGAGGVSVAIGELADGLCIDLNAVPKKYDGLTGTELAISESQERMAVVLAAADTADFLALAGQENLEATVVARVTAEPRLVMTWNGQTVVDLARAFIDTNGARKHAQAVMAAPRSPQHAPAPETLASALETLALDLNACSRRGLVERFDSTIGAGTVLMPYGGQYQRTPTQAMVANLPVLNGETQTCSAMAWGFDPLLMERSAYHGAYCAVIESVARLAASGAGLAHCHLTFQEYFERLGNEPCRWGKPLAALLGALDAQLALGVGAIGGKDSMSGSFEDMAVPPTLVSFAVSVGDASTVLSPEFKQAGAQVVWLAPQTDAHGCPDGASMRALLQQVCTLIETGAVRAACTPGHGGILAAVRDMALGNRIGFSFAKDMTLEQLTRRTVGGFLLELCAPQALGVPLGETTSDYALVLGNERIDLAAHEAQMEATLEPVFPTRAAEPDLPLIPCDYRAEHRPAPHTGIAAPRVLIPVFPGTNCEYDTARAFRMAGALPELFILDNRSASGVADSVARFCKQLSQSQILCIPGGFSAGDEPDGSGKFITAFLRNPAATEQVQALLAQRDGLILGICNGFQVLIKLGLVPDGTIMPPAPHAPTLTFNTIGRHQSRICHTRVASNRSAWMMYANVGDVRSMPISHGEGRFVCPPETLAQLAKNGQIATQYCDERGNIGMSIEINPNGSINAVEGITSPDGRVLGKMGHSERYGDMLYRNVPGRDDRLLFAGAVDYFRK